MVTQQRRVLRVESSELLIVCLSVIQRVRGRYGFKTRPFCTCVNT